MPSKYLITPDFRYPPTLDDGDRALIDAIQLIAPGHRGDINSNEILREPARRAVGISGERIAGRVLTDSGLQDIVYIDVFGNGLLVALDTRRPGSRGYSDRKYALPSSFAGASTPESHAVKLEAVRRISLANEVTLG